MTSAKPEDGKPNYRKSTLKESIAIHTLLKRVTSTSNGVCTYLDGYSDERVADECSDAQTSDKTGYRLNANIVSRLRRELGFGSLIAPQSVRPLEGTLNDIDRRLRALESAIRYFENSLGVDTGTGITKPTTT